MITAVVGIKPVVWQEGGSFSIFMSPHHHSQVQNTHFKDI